MLLLSSAFVSYKVNKSVFDIDIFHFSLSISIYCHMPSDSYFLLYLGVCRNNQCTHTASGDDVY